MNLLLIILITILLSAFFSGMEIAFVSANKLRLELDIQSEPFSSKILKLVTRDAGRYIATMLVGNNIALVIYGIAFASLLEPVFQNYIQSESLILFLQTIVSTLIILVFAEFMPKTLFRIFPNILLTIFAIPLALFYFVFYPITRVTIWITNSLLKLFLNTDVKTKSKNPVFGRIELDEFVREPDVIGLEKKSNMEKEVKLFKNALDFSKVKLREIMVPRTEIEMLDINSNISDLRQKFVETGYSRILFFTENVDNIVGYVQSSIIFQNPRSIKPYLQNVLIAPETMPANKLLSTFIKEHRSIAIVVDEFGGTSGMVTSEDILEEIFGEIEDEHDTSDIIEKKISETEYIFSGRSEIDLLNEKYFFNLPEKEEFETLAGLILYHYESIPKINTEIKIGKFQLKILKATNTKIELVKLSIDSD
ncbi:MAG: HlyC/CorC family transporter [Prolixibacteraceae bacterium]|jgi:CBS domain containing-hemolysin-like protein|nr:HlyC/CorC family transporter [Prolixibacteraceae bacterium]MBT6999015.1 HlyC/CorC family transporter [Prolixibacteraceae bacterium]MBT7394486.1 HlyC/CorC family transporter [Prolixibacteraceae bacterium]